MTFLAHAAVVAAALHEAGAPLPVVVAGALGAAAPDLVAAPETLRGRWDNLYDWTHHPGALVLVCGLLACGAAAAVNVLPLVFFAGWLSHLAIDSGCHDPATGKWTGSGYFLEGLTWGATAVYLWKVLLT